MCNVAQQKEKNKDKSRARARKMGKNETNSAEARTLTGYTRQLKIRVRF